MKTSLCDTILCSSPFDLDTEGSGGVQHEAANSRDDVMEERAWEAFCMLLFFSYVLVRNAKVSKEDLRRRFDLFAHRTWEILVDGAVATLPVKVQEHFCPQLTTLSTSCRGKRFQEVARELSEHVRAFVPETPLVVAKDHSIESQVITRSFSSRAQRMHVRAFMGVRG